MRTDFVIVGAGICGLSAAWALRRRGHEVLVLDQGPVGNSDGGSHGSCRIFRLGYENPAYVRLAAQAQDNWTDLEEACGEELLHPTPQLTFGPQLAEVRAAMAQAGAPFELMSAAEAEERFPGVALTGPVLFETASAVISADLALAGLVRLSGQPSLPPARVTGLADYGSGVRVSTTEGEISADRVIVCAGASTTGLVAGLGIAVPWSASLEQVSYFAPAAPARSPLPIVVHYGGEFPYGLPVPRSDHYKLGIHFGGPQVDPERQDHSEDSGLTARTERAVRQLLPALEPRSVRTERCIYDVSPDHDFIIDRIGNVVIGCGTSGHGFKFGPLIGEWLAGLAANGPGHSGGGADPAAPPSQFALSRF